MTETHYERLSFLDSTFLAMEGPNTPMHVGATLLFDAGELARDTGGVDVERIRRFVLDRLQYVPRYRQRLEWIPLERHPVWVDDAHFDVEYHIRHAALPHPGSEDRLRALAGRIFAQRLDRGRPLWECWVVEGVEGDRFALVTKVHHCMIDGIAGVDLLKVLLSPVPDTTIGDPEPFEPRPAPSPAQLLRDEAVRRLKGPLDASRGLRRFVDDTRDLGSEVAHRVRAMTTTVRSGWLQNASLTPVNRTIGPNRRVAWMRSDLAEVKRVKDHYGCTVNDVLIAAVAGGMRSFLADDRGVDVADLDFRAMVPVSLRGEVPAVGELGNKITMWLVDLPIDEPSVTARLEAVASTTRRLKDTDQALGAAMLTQGASWTPGTLMSLAARVAASTVRPFNLTVTNVPGPQIPLFLMGSRMLANYPLVPLWVNHGVSIALFSYDGHIAWGLASDADLVPDLEIVADRLAAALDELVDAATPKPKRTTAKKRPAKKATAKKQPAKKATAKKQPARKTTQPKATTERATAAQAGRRESGTGTSAR
jgi:WS/DGAT/MGAT family acyltransferase